MSLTSQPIGWDYSAVTEYLRHANHLCSTAPQIAKDVGLTRQRVYELLNCAEADSVVVRTPYAGKNRAELWRLK